MDSLPDAPEMRVRDRGAPETGRPVARELHAWDPQGLIRTWMGVWARMRTAPVAKTDGSFAPLLKTQIFVCFLCLETVKELGELEETASTDPNSQVRAC